MWGKVFSWGSFILRLMLSFKCHKLYAHIYMHIKCMWSSGVMWWHLNIPYFFMTCTKHSLCGKHWAKEWEIKDKSNKIIAIEFTCNEIYRKCFQFKKTGESSEEMVILGVSSCPWYFLLNLFIILILMRCLTLVNMLLISKFGTDSHSAFFLPLTLMVIISLI